MGFGFCLIDSHSAVVNQPINSITQAPVAQISIYIALVTGKDDPKGNQNPGLGLNYYTQFGYLSPSAATFSTFNIQGSDTVSKEL